MKKLLSFVLMIILLSGFSICQAISPNRMNAGGIYIFQSLSEVEAIYGKPVSVKSEQVNAGFRHTNTIYEYGRYGTTFKIIFVGNKVMYIRVAGNNGIATSDGIKVGTPLSEVKRILGPGKEITNGSSSFGSHQISYRQDELRDPLRMMIFYIKNNKVDSYIVDSGVDI